MVLGAQLPRRYGRLSAVVPRRRARAAGRYSVVTYAGGGPDRGDRPVTGAVHGGNTRASPPHAAVGVPWWCPAPRLWALGRGGSSAPAVFGEGDKYGRGRVPKGSGAGSWAMKSL